MEFNFDGQNIELEIDQIYVAGWTGRDREAVDHHIKELAELGVAPPSEVPLYYRVSHSLLCQTNRIEVLGDTTSGEVEPLLIKHSGKIWIGLGSDHTDRELEAHTVAASKQACPKPVAKELWSFESVLDHLDSLILRCSILEKGKWVLYQEGTIASIKPLQDLVKAAGLADGAAMLCGTLPAIGTVRPATEYKMELHDPLLLKNIRMRYSVSCLPVMS